MLVGVTDLHVGQRENCMGLKRECSYQTPCTNPFTDPCLAHINQNPNPTPAEEAIAGLHYTAAYFSSKKTYSVVNSLTRCPTEVSHLPRRVTTEIRTSDVWPTKQDGQWDGMSDKSDMRIQHRTGHRSHSKHPHVTDRKTAQLPSDGQMEICNCNVYDD